MKAGVETLPWGVERTPAAWRDRGLAAGEELEADAHATTACDRPADEVRRHIAADYGVCQCLRAGPSGRCRRTLSCRVGWRRRPPWGRCRARGRVGRAAARTRCWRSKSSGREQAELEREHAGGAHPNRDRLAVEQGAVAGDGLKGVADGVAVVEERPAAGLAFVFGDDAALIATLRAMSSATSALGRRRRPRWSAKRLVSRMRPCFMTSAQPLPAADARGASRRTSGSITTARGWAKAPMMFLPSA